MKSSVVIFIAFVVFHAVTFVESGYLVTSLRIFHAGSTQRLSVSLFAVSTPWNFSATVYYKDRSGGIIASDERQFSSLSDGVLKLKIPKDLGTGNQQSIKAKLSVRGGPSGGKRAFRKSEIITIEIPKKSLFIQTDKPIYKPGQTVNMRIVGTNENLKPLTGKISRVTITSPSKVRIMQWEDLDFVVGIISLKFPLSSQPVLGDWKIDATYKGEKKTLVFKVDKYVLPKFEVTITPPSFVAFTDDNDITATICAKYTYGQPVKGKVSVLFKKLKVYWWQKAEQATAPEKEINGCTEVSVNRKLLFKNRRHYHMYNNYMYGSRGKIAIYATVKEAATGVTQNATGTETQIVKETTKVEFLATTPTTFKPGMAFTGQVKATLIDGSPLKGESVKIHVQYVKSGYSYYSTNYQKVFIKSFIIPENGIVDFVVPGSNISKQAKSLLLEAKYKGKNSASYRVWQRWHSPSNSYIEMEKITSPLKVGSTAKVMFDFTANTETKNINFHFQVFSRGKLLTQGRKLHPVDYHPGMKTFQNSKKETMFTGHGFIEFSVIQKMVPSCRLLLFHVRDDQETVADSMLIDIQDTLENKVNVHFADSVRKPGEQTRLIITASPGSQVAVTAVDKSVHLLKGGNELTVGDAINVLSSQDVGPAKDDRDSCYRMRPWWRREPRSKRSYYGYGQTKPLDASQAFKDSGVIYFSDLKIKTAKCERQVYTHYGHRRFGIARMGVEYSEDAGPDVESNSQKKTNKVPVTKRNAVKVRKEFPETWLWTEEMVNSCSSASIIWHESCINWPSCTWRS